MTNPVSFFLLSLFPQFPMDIHYKDDSEYFLIKKTEKFIYICSLLEKFIFAMDEMLFFKD